MKDFPNLKRSSKDVVPEPTEAESLKEAQRKAKRKRERSRAAKERAENHQQQDPPELSCNLSQTQDAYRVVFRAPYSREQDLPTRKEVVKASRLRALIVHPDKGGDPHQFRQLEEAKDTLIQIGEHGIRRYTLTEMIQAKEWLGLVDMVAPNSRDLHELTASQVTEAYATSMRHLEGFVCTDFERGMHTYRRALARDVLLDIATNGVWRVYLNVTMDKIFPGAFKGLTGF